MDKIIIIESQWLNYIAKCYPEIDRESNQFKIMKMTFYAGYATFYSFIRANGIEPKNSELLEIIKEEIEIFNERLT